MLIFAVMSIIFGYNVRQNTTYAVKSQSFEACPPLLTAGTEKKWNAHANSSPICSPHRAWYRVDMIASWCFFVTSRSPEISHGMDAVARSHWTTSDAGAAPCLCVGGPNKNQWIAQSLEGHSTVNRTNWSPQCHTFFHSWHLWRRYSSKKQWDCCVRMVICA